MLRSQLSLPLVAALAAILAAFIGTELWLHDYDFAKVRFDIPTTNRFQEPDIKQNPLQDDLSCSAKDGSPTLHREPGYYESDLSKQVQA